jgi:hypothetical protein
LVLHYRAGNADELSRAAQYILGSGLGCDMRLMTEPRNESFAARMKAYDLATRDMLKAAKFIWKML